MTPTPTPAPPAKPTWRTTLLGILLLGLTAYRIYTNPAAALTDPTTIGLLGSAGGLIGATDKILGR